MNNRSKEIGLILFAVLALAGCSNNQTLTEAKKSVEQIEDKSRLSENISGLNNKKSTNQMQENKMVLPTEEEVKMYTEKYNGAVMKTNMGDIRIKFYGTDSPKTVANFMKLADNKFYDGIKFHRVIKDFMIQSGDPNSKSDDWSIHGMGDPGYKFRDEFNSHGLIRGSLAMANSGPNTNGSQFFIVTAEATPWLDGKHTNFGEVVEGMDIIDKIESAETNANDHPLKDITIESITLLTK